MFLNALTIVVTLIFAPLTVLSPVSIPGTTELSTGLSTSVESFVMSENPSPEKEEKREVPFWEQWCLTQECLVSVLEDVGVSMTQEQMIEHGKSMIVKTLSKALVGIVVESFKVFIITAGITFGVIIAGIYALVWRGRVKARHRAEVVVQSVSASGPPENL